MGLSDRLVHAWNAFTNRDPTSEYKQIYSQGITYSTRPDRVRFTRGNERSIITSVYNRIAVDAASINVSHVRLDENDRFIGNMVSGLQECLTVEANIDQSGREFIQDVVASMLDEGCVAIVPVDTTIDPEATNSYDIRSMRTAKIIQWKPKHVQVRVYNDNTGQKEDIWVPKRMVAIIENPFYTVMNEPNSTLQRLIRKLNLLDAIDEQSGSGKLDLIIQLPYVIKSEAKRKQADERKAQIEEQLKGPYGIAYTDGTERITQLNRPVENNLMKQIEFLTNMLHSQLGITQSIMDGTADEKTMLNYFNRTIEPILSAVVDGMKRKFLSKSARTQKQTIMFFRDPFKLVPVSEIAEIADKFTRNEITSSNEMRQVICMKPSKDPKADELRNKNITQPTDGPSTPPTESAPETSTEEPDLNTITEDEYLKSIGELDEFDSELDDMEAEVIGKDLKHYSSQYYDPVKAHEYYEKNKQLKGRKSTARLNDDGKAAAKYVKEQLTTEKKGVLETEKVSVKNQIESEKTQMRSKIDSLRAKLKGMSSSEKQSNSEGIKAQIARLREDNKAIREKLQTAFKGKREAVKDEYDEKYIQELDKIRNTSSFVKSKKR